MQNSALVLTVGMARSTFDLRYYATFFSTFVFVAKQLVKVSVSKMLAVILAQKYLNGYSFSASGKKVLAFEQIIRIKMSSVANKFHIDKLPFICTGIYPI